LCLGKVTFRDRLLKPLDKVTQPADGYRIRTGEDFRCIYIVDHTGMVDRIVGK
jgi:hypothetical protein